jgi:hypothetical protein
MFKKWRGWLVLIHEISLSRPNNNHLLRTRYKYEVTLNIPPDVGRSEENRSMK